MDMRIHIGAAASMVRGVLSTPLPLFLVVMLALAAFALALGHDPPLLEAPPEALVVVTAAVPAVGAAWLGVMAWRDRSFYAVVAAIVAASFAVYAAWLFMDGMGMLPWAGAPALSMLPTAVLVLVMGAP